LLLTRKIMNHKFLVVNVKSSLQKFNGRHDDLVNIYTGNHGYLYVLYIIVTILSLFSHLWLITRYLTSVTRQVQPVEKKLLTLQEHLRTLLLVWYVLFNLKFWVVFFVLFFWHCIVWLSICIIQ
jgi:hypothetical protein